VGSRQEAFDAYLADGARAAVEREEPGLLDSIVRIREGGGMASLAHPSRLQGGDATFLKSFLPSLVSAGLDALEVYHSDHSLEQTARFQSLAREFDLVETGGSDFHGENKPGVRLGSGRGQLALERSILDNMRRRSLQSATMAEPRE